MRFEYERETYVDTPKFLHRVKSDHLLQKIVPVVLTLNLALALVGVDLFYFIFFGKKNPKSVYEQRTFGLGGLVNQRVHLFIKGCLTLKFSGEWNTVNCSLLLASEAPASSASSSLAPLGGETGISLRGRCSSRTSTMVGRSDDAVVMIFGVFFLV